MPTMGREISVFYRIFPMPDTQWDLVRIEKSTFYVKNIQGLSNDKRSLKFWEFKSDGIFTDSSQEIVYTEVINGLLERVTQGYNGIILGFGQTGAGKSFTLGGLQFSEKEFGIAPRVIFDLFKLKNEFPKNIDISIHMSYTEFSKMNVIDLLKDFPNSVDPWHVKNASKIKVETEYEALKLLYRGEGRKTFANNNTYMSHIGSTVLTFHITMANQDFTCPEKISSRLHMVDMAGVDSVGNSSSNFKDPLDVGNANIIKSHMEQFILHLTKSVPKYIQVKERTSPLLYFLGNDLNNQSALRFIGHVRIQKKDLKIALSTLRFGQLVKGLKPKMKEIEPEMNEEVTLQYLQRDLEKLQEEKVYHSILMNQDLTTDLNQDRIEHLRTTIDAYLHNRLTELQVLNVAEATEAFKIFRSIVNAFEEDKNRALRDSSDTHNAKPRHSSKSSSKTSLKNLKVSKRMKRASASTFEKTKHVDSAVSLRPKRSVVISHSPFNASASHSNVKKFMSTPTSLSKQSPSGLARRSTVSSSTKDRKESKSYLTDTIVLPNILPKYEKVWPVFITDSKSTYKVLHSAYKHNELELKRVYASYQREIQNLQLCKKIVQRRQNELLDARLLQQFYAPVGSNDIVTDSEKICQEHLNCVQERLLEQQEVILKLQSELKALLYNRQDIKQNIQEEFDQYCKDSYKVIVPCLEEEEEELLLKEETLNVEIRSGGEDMEEEQTKLQEKSTLNLDNLKRIMEKELQKSMKFKELKSQKWKNVY